MLVSMPCFCSSSQARMPSQVDAICTASKPFVGPHASIGNPYLRSVSGLSRAKSAANWRIDGIKKTLRMFEKTGLTLIYILLGSTPFFVYRSISLKPCMATN